MPFRFSGHESFPCRYAWLPKAVRALEVSSLAFSNEEQAMVTLGVGKNMVRSIRFWMLATGVAEPKADGGYQVTSFGKALMSDDGWDPFLEDICTLWLLHWKIATHNADPLFAWDYLLNHWARPELSRSEAIKAFRQEADKCERPPSTVTLEQHFDIFLHTYVPSRAHKGEVQEDELECPLVELELLQTVGERVLDGTGKRELVYAFRRERKPDISPELFLYCLDEFRRKRRAYDKAINFRDIALAPGSPGQIFKLPEWDVRQRLETISNDSEGLYLPLESATLPQVRYMMSEENNSMEIDLLYRVLSREERNAESRDI